MAQPHYLAEGHQSSGEKDSERHAQGFPGFAVETEDGLTSWDPIPGYLFAGLSRIPRIPVCSKLLLSGAGHARHLQPVLHRSAFETLAHDQKLRRLLWYSRHHASRHGQHRIRYQTRLQQIPRFPGLTNYAYLV